VNTDEEIPLALFDYTEIDQVLTNLIENAIKYTPPGTPISVRVYHKVDNRGDSIEVVVEDEGPGVEPEHLPHLFDKFYRVDPHRARGGSGSGGKGGVGLGLSITKGLVEAHGGHIQAANRPEGGLRVTFTIPVNGSGQPTSVKPEAPAGTASIAV